MNKCEFRTPCVVLMGIGALFSGENHPNRKLSGSELISDEQGRVKAP
jgi:hypothetical protein